MQTNNQDVNDTHCTIQYCNILYFTMVYYATLNCTVRTRYKISGGINQN